MNTDEYGSILATEAQRTQRPPENHSDLFLCVLCASMAFFNHLCSSLFICGYSFFVSPEKNRLMPGLKITFPPSTTTSGLDSVSDFCSHLKCAAGSSEVCQANGNPASFAGSSRSG